MVSGCTKTKTTNYHEKEMLGSCEFCVCRHPWEPEISCQTAHKNRSVFSFSSLLLLEFYADT